MAILGHCVLVPFAVFLLTSDFLMCTGEPIFFKKEDMFTISGDIQPTNAIFHKNHSIISVNDKGESLTLICKSSYCPVEWRLEKFRLQTFPDDLKASIKFSTTRKVLDFNEPSSYEYSAEIKISTPSNKVTGNYICKCSGLSSSQQNSSVYVYWAGSSSSYLLQAGEHQVISRTADDSTVRIQCGVSKPDQKVYLHKIHEFVDHDKTFTRTVLRSTAILMTLNESVHQDVDGFTLNVNKLRFPYGDYICSLKTSLLERDIVPDSRSATLQTRIKVENKIASTRMYRQKQITSYHTMNSQSEDSVFYDHRDNTLICCDKDSTESHEQVGFYCENPQQCNFFKYRLTAGHNANAQNDTCTSYMIGKEAYSGAATFRCTFNKNDASMDLDVRGEQFFSLKSDTYFGLEEANPSRMVQAKLENSNRILFYGEPLNFTCQTASYPFSQGIVWTLKRQDGSQIVINRETTPEYKVEQLKSNSEITLRIYDDFINRIECHAPLWNSDKWWSSEISLNLSESLKPMIVGETETTLRINPGDEIATAECRASGVPKPIIKWRKDKMDFYPEVQILEGTRDTTVEKIHILLIDLNKENFDSYECVAVNVVGEATKSFHLKSGERNTKIVQIIGISVGLLVLFIIIMIFLLRKIFVQRRALRHLTKAEIEEFEKGKPEALANWKGDTNGCSNLLPYNPAYEIPRITLHIDEGKILGQGTYGIVMKGYLRKGTRGEKVVAVKTIKPNEDVMHFKILLCELKIMAFIGSHPHIVSLVGACSRDIRNRQLLVAIEYCDNGNMHDYLRKCRESYKNLFVQYDKKTNKISTQGLSDASYANFPKTSVFNIEDHTELDSKQLLEWASQIASGMEFLSSKKVIHGDLAARNILLTADFTAKIGDFGLSKQIFEYTTYTKKTIVLLPWKWMSIESLQDMTFSVMSDVWSYGVTLWEMFTLAQIPYPGTSWDDEFIDKLIGDYRLPQPQFASKEIYEVMLVCWARRPEHRPSFSDLKETFINFISELQIKIDQTHNSGK